MIQNRVLSATAAAMATAYQDKGSLYEAHGFAPSGSRGVNMRPHNAIKAGKAKVRNKIARASRRINRMVSR